MAKDERKTRPPFCNCRRFSALNHEPDLTPLAEAPHQPELPGRGRRRPRAKRASLGYCKPLNQPRANLVGLRIDPRHMPAIISAGVARHLINILCVTPQSDREGRASSTWCRRCARSDRRPGKAISVSSLATASGNDQVVEGRFNGDPYCAAKCSRCRAEWPETRVEGIGPGTIKCVKCGAEATPFLFTNGYTIDGAFLVGAPHKYSMSAEELARHKTDGHLDVAAVRAGATIFLRVCLDLNDLAVAKAARFVARRSV